MVGDRELLVQDPDGYLLRFSQYLGERPISPRNEFCCLSQAYKLDCELAAEHLVAK
jgi:hypothetical protein